MSNNASKNRFFKTSTEFDPDEGAMKDRVASGVLITGVSQSVRVGTQVVAVIVLSRLLSPTQFGLVAMASPFFGVISLFQDIGLGQAIIQKKTLTHSEVNALFWVNMFVGFFLCVATFGIAPIAGWFYHEPAVINLIMAMSAIVMFAMFGSQQNAILARKMKFTSIALLDASAAVGGLLTSLIWALVSPTFWALYIGMLISTAIPAIGAWFLAGWLPTRPSGIGHVKGMLRFGAGVTGFNLFNFLARNLDNALIGRRWGETSLGFYDRAYKLLLFPLQQITNPMARVMVPALSRLHDEPDRYRSAFGRALALMLVVALPGVALMICMADVVIPLALGEKWVGAVPIFQALGLASVVQVLNNPSGWLMLSQGRARLMAIWGAVTASTSALAFVIGLPFGPIGVALAYAVSEYIRTPFLWYLISRKGPVSLVGLIGVVWPVYTSVFGAAAALWLAKKGLGHLPGIVQIGVGTVLVYGVSIGLMLLSSGGRDTIKEGRGLLVKLTNKAIGGKGN
jgi:PST family polysaccharide transporter